MPAQRVTVALLRNADWGVDPWRLGDQLATFAAGRPFPQTVPITLTAEQLSRFEGVYGQGNDSRTLRVVNGALTSQRRGGPVIPLTPTGNARFAFPNWAQLAFEQDGDGKVVSLRFFPEGDGDSVVWPRAANCRRGFSVCAH